MVGKYLSSSFFLYMSDFDAIGVLSAEMISIATEFVA